jgi:hypothetical protein
MALTDDLWAVIPSGERLVELKRLVFTLVNDGVNVIVVDTGYPADVWGDVHPNVTIVRDTMLPKNISRWWNVGLRQVAKMCEAHEYTVAVLNDDVVLPPGSVKRLAEALEVCESAAACPMPGWPSDYITLCGRETHYRMTGFAFALRGSLELRADERLQWWYGDNDLDWQARQSGGMTLVGGKWDGYAHLYPNSTTVGALAEQAHRDRPTFVEKWGMAPW